MKIGQHRQSFLGGYLKVLSGLTKVLGDNSMKCMKWIELSAQCSNCAVFDGDLFKHFWLIGNDKTSHT